MARTVARVSLVHLVADRIEFDADWYVLARGRGER